MPGPEQDYLARFFAAFDGSGEGRGINPGWTHLSCRYNFQLHLELFGSPEWHMYNFRPFPDVKIMHFSGKLLKPWEYVIDLMLMHGWDINEVRDFITRRTEKAGAGFFVDPALGQYRMLLTKVDVDSDDAEIEKRHECQMPSWVDIESHSDACHLRRPVHPT
jgi:hypothetical protein